MAEELRRHMPQTLRFAARRPAGTREALPGAASQGLRPVKNINSSGNCTKQLRSQRVILNASDKDA
jgi:hypothetical protein